MRALSIALSFLVLSIAACSPGAQHAGSGDTWAGTITTEGDVTTVVNESGSVWGRNRGSVRDPLHDKRYAAERSVDRDTVCVIG